MANSQIQKYLEFANMQMATEAFLLRATDNGALPDNLEIVGRLNTGNTHASKFTAGQAEDFVSRYEVLAQYRNDPLLGGGAGFSGTLFKNRSTGELTLSFRSTEFIDDAVRDSKATNELEVKALGWAFGQIEEMESWYAQLLQRPDLLGGRAFNVTGYSLGGHLATAFNLLRRDELARNGTPNPIIATYTFNGAGVGRVADGTRLIDALGVFREIRIGADSAYRDSLGSITQTAIETAAAVRVARIEYERLRLGSPLFNAPFAFNSLPPAGIQSSLQYQIAALVAARNTVPVTAFPFPGGANWVPTEPVFASSLLANFTEIVGSDGGRLGPSFVSNSGIHHGERQPIYIEDQPLTRGRYSLLDDRGSLHTSPVTNDFADTHSLVLLVDSLSLLAAFESLDPSFTADDGADLLAAASNARASTLFLTQGRAEGDTLERALDGLRKLVFGGEPPPTVPDYAATLVGNSWHDGQMRAAFHDNLKLLNGRIAELKAEPGFAPRLQLLADVGEDDLLRLANDPGQDGLAYRYALRELNPYALVGFYHGHHNRGGELNLVDDSTGAGTITPEWIEARASMLAAFTEDNMEDGLPERAFSHRYEDFARDLRLGPVGPAIGKIVFGAGAPDAIFGTAAEDMLFGGAGGDTLAGNAGDDHLQGDAGDDVLDGGGAADTMWGGAGTDRLTGALGDDVLDGGGGFDTYVYAAGDGFDTIYDADGQGAIEYKGRRLQGGNRSAARVFEDDGGTRYILSGDPAAQQTLLIDGNIQVEGFTSGMLGIVLDGEGAGPQPPGAAGTNFYADSDFPSGQSQGGDVGDVMARDFLGSNANDVVAMSGNRSYYTRAGDDRVRVTGSDRAVLSIIDTGSGADLIDAAGWFGTGDLRIYGGAGEDFIIGGAPGLDIYGDNHAVTENGDGSMVIDGFHYNLGASDRGLTDERPGDVQFLQRSGASEPFIRAIGNAGSSGDVSYESVIDLVRSEGWYLPGGLPHALAYVLGAAPSFDDYIETGAGAFVVAGSGSDTVFGGPGSDSIEGDYGSTPGALSYAGLRERFGELAELFGLPGDDYLDGRDGDDSITDQDGGNDILIGGTGNDTIVSGNFVFAEEDEDDDTGDPGRTVDLSAFDYIEGGDGNDDISVFGRAYVDGGKGDDRYFSVSSGVIRDGGGDDSLTLSPTLAFDLAPPVPPAGPPGSAPPIGPVEVFRAEAGETSVSRSGNDLVLFSSSDGASRLVFGDWYLGSEHRIERIGSMSAAQFESWGSAQTGSDAADAITGGEYADRILARGGSDLVETGSGNDRIIGGTGDDVLDGGPGDDVYSYARGDGADVVLDSAGADVLRLLPGISRQDVSAGLVEGGLAIRIAGGSVTLPGVDADSLQGDLPIDTIAFADGSTASVASIVAPDPSPQIVPVPDPELPVGFPPPAEPAETAAPSDEFTPMPANEPASAVPAATADPGPMVAGVSPVEADGEEFAIASAEPLPQPGAPPPIGESFDPVYRDIDARLDVLLQAGRSNLGERYAQAIEEFERRRSGSGETPSPAPGNEEIGRWNEAVHDWHARHPSFDSAAGEAGDGIWTASWAGVAGSGASLDELVGAGAAPLLANPAGLARLSGVRPAPGLKEGLAQLGG